MAYLQGYSEGGTTDFAARQMMLGTSVRRPMTGKSLIRNAISCFLSYGRK